LKNLETLILARKEIDDNVWNQFIDASPQAIIYAYTWYLDSICEDWLAIVTQNKLSEWVAVMPIPFFTKLNVQRCYMPIFCQHLSVFFKPLKIKREKELGLKKKILQQTINAIPLKIKIFKYQAGNKNEYLLPFYWKGYQLNLRYSYYLKIEENKQINYQLFSHKTRTCINKAINNGLSIINCTNIESIIDIGKNNIDVAFDEKALLKLWEVLKPKNLINAVTAVNSNGETYAGIIYLKFRDKYIYLFGAANKTYKHLGGMSLIIWHIIQHSENGIKYHDFQGSMIESIEKFYRGFDTYPKPYYQIYKNNLPLPLKIIHQLYNTIKSK